MKIALLPAEKRTKRNYIRTRCNSPFSTKARKDAISYFIQRYNFHGNRERKCTHNNYSSYNTSSHDIVLLALAHMWLRLKVICSGIRISAAEPHLVVFLSKRSFIDNSLRRKPLTIAISINSFYVRNGIQLPHVRRFQFIGINGNWFEPNCFNPYRLYRTYFSVGVDF